MSRQTSKMTPAVEKFLQRHKDAGDLDGLPYSVFKKECPRVEISDATYYAWRRKFLGLEPYGTKPIRKATRQRLYKQFFSIEKKNTTNEAVVLLRQFIDKMNASNHHSRFEIIEYNIVTEGDPESMVEVREYK